jgi:hypothetical protein
MGAAFPDLKEIAARFSHDGAQKTATGTRSRNPVFGHPFRRPLPLN